jgi:hypothetical protein
MGRTIRSMEEAVAWHGRYGPRAPKEGDPARDFRLYDASGSRAIRLSDFRGKRPVVLAFGSYT